MNRTINTDNLYDQPFIDLDEFAFDQRVVDVFPDMIKRSVPGYSTIIHMIGQLAERYAQTNSRCYDLGSSLGAATLAIRHRIQAAEVKIIAVDSSSEMVKRCQIILDADSAEIPVELLCTDIADVDIHSASLVILNFTLQFIPVENRAKLLNKIYQGMKPGGVLVLSEKLQFEDKHHDQLMTELHHYFKKTNGYSDLEIAQKRSALENVLIPEPIEKHKNRLNQAGFANVDLWFQCFNFASLLAFK